MIFIFFFLRLSILYRLLIMKILDLCDLIVGITIFMTVDEPGYNSL